IALQPPFGLQLAAAHQQHGVAVDNPAAMIDEDRSIAVAVEGYAQVTAMVDHGAGQRFRVRRSAMQIDVAAVGLIPCDECRYAERAEQSTRDRRRRSV